MKNFTFLALNFFAVVAITQIARAQELNPKDLYYKDYEVGVPANLPKSYTILSACKIQKSLLSLEDKELFGETLEEAAHRIYTLNSGVTSNYEVAPNRVIGYCDYIENTLLWDDGANKSAPVKTIYIQTTGNHDPHYIDMKKGESLRSITKKLSKSRAYLRYTLDNCGCVSGSYAEPAEGSYNWNLRYGITNKLPRNKQ